MKAYYDKGTRRLKRILGKIVPYNTHYRPSNVCKINLEDFTPSNPRELCIHPVYPALITRLNISEDLYQACSEYWKPKKEVRTDYMVVEVPNGRIYTDNISSVAVVTQYNHLVENVSLSLMSGKVSAPNLNNIFEQRYFNPPTKLKGTVFSLLTGGAGINNISHWFVDVLPRLHLLRESGLYDKVDWFYVPSTRYSYQTETLELLGIPADKIISGETHPHIAADCVIASTAPRGNHTLVPQWLCDFIQESFMPYAEKESDMLVPGSPYLYISRSDSKMRNVINEKELLEVLKPYGFKCVIASQLSIKEKIKLFSKAKVVMGATGAGLISMLFCKPGTKMIELFNEGFVIEPFYDIASKIDLDYEYIICKGNKRVRNASQGQRENLQVEIEKVVEILEMMREDKREKKCEVA